VEKVKETIDPGSIAIWNTLFSIQESGNGKLAMEPCYENPEGSKEINHNRALYLFALKRMELRMERESKARPPTVEMKGITPVTSKTIEAIDYAFKNIDKFESEFPRLSSEVIEKAKRLYNGKAERDGRKILDYFLPDPSSSPPAFLSAISKRESCLICGMEGELEFNETYAFGFKPTAGSGRKVSSGNYTTYKICGLCATEMELRMKELGEGNKDNAATLQLSMGSYIHPLNPEIIERIREIAEFSVNSSLPPAGKESGAGDSVAVKFERVNLVNSLTDCHQIVFLPSPNKSDKYVQYIRIREMLNFIESTGFKIRILPVSASSVIPEEVFSMENTEPWVHALKLNSVHLDELDNRIKNIETIEKLVRLGKDWDENSVLRIIMNLSHNPFSIYRIVRELISEKYENPVYKLKEFYPVVFDYAQRNAVSEIMEIKELVEPALGIMPSAPESPYEDEKLIREALKVTERHKNESEADILSYICGNIRSLAGEGTWGKYMTAEREEAIRKFAERFLIFYKEKMAVMNSSRREDVIAAFGYEYHIAMWKKVNEKKAAKNEAQEGENQ
ncbi:MAG: hypothetical protein QXK90_02860, partial [Candidatus Parvarchaeota archaeon]